MNNNNEHFAQFGEHAPAVQAFFEGALQEVQQRIVQLEQQVAQPPPPAVVDAQGVAQAVAAAVAAVPQAPAPVPVLVVLNL